MNTNGRTIGGACILDLQPSYVDDLKLTFSYIIDPPELGRLTQFREIGFSYVPPGSYKGIDRFAIQVCGARKGSAETCFRINYAVEVRCSGQDECGASSVPENLDKSL